MQISHDRAKKMLSSPVAVDRLQPMAVIGIEIMSHFRGRQQHLVDMSGPMAELKLMVSDTQVGQRRRRSK